MTFLLHGKKISKEISEEVIKFIDELIKQNIKIIYIDSFYRVMKKKLEKYSYS